jgi:heat shock protein HslJ
MTAGITAPSTPVPVGTPIPAGGGGGPSLAELKAATYQGFDGWKEPVTLVDGRWENEGAHESLVFGRDFRAVGDIDGDTVQEAVVVLTQTTSAGAVDYLALVKRKEGKLKNVGTVRLGNGVQIRAARIEAGRVVLSAVHPGEGDEACCPGEMVEWSFAFADGKLGPPKVEGKPIRLGLEALAGSEWVLREWDLAEAAPAEPAITLAYEEGRFVGSSGCNRYSAAAGPGAKPGDVGIQQSAGTLQACPEPQSTAEARYLKLLPSATRFGFLLGQLSLTYPKAEGPSGQLLFEARAAAPTASK